MKVSKKSWHYQLNIIFNENLVSKRRWSNLTLCDYFWGTVKSILLMLGMGCFCFMLGAAGIFMLYLVFNYLVFIVSGIWGIPLHWVSVDNAVGFAVLTCGVSTVGGVVALLSGEINFFPEYIKKPFRKTKTTSRKEIKPSLVVEMYKAHKAKWCPLIEIED